MLWAEKHRERYVNANWPHYQRRAEAALTALESTGYIVRPREATEGMVDSAISSADYELNIMHMDVEAIDTAMTEAWLKERDRD